MGVDGKLESAAEFVLDHAVLTVLASMGWSHSKVLDTPNTVHAGVRVTGVKLGVKAPQGKRVDLTGASLEDCLETLRTADKYDTHCYYKLSTVRWFRS